MNSFICSPWCAYIREMLFKTSSTTFLSLLLMSSFGLTHSAYANKPQAGGDILIQEKETLEAPDDVSFEQDQAREREQEVSEDPMAQRELDKVDNPEELKRQKDLLLKGYASLRYRYRRYEGENVLGDSDTRVGGGISWRFKEHWRVFANGEIGISLLDEVDALLNQKGGTGENGLGDTIYRRLLYW